MKTIFDGDVMVGKITGKKAVDNNSVYRWSNYAVFHSCDGKNYLYNNFTKKIIELENENIKVDSDVRYQPDEINNDECLTTLVADQFLVPENRDETAVYENYCRLRRAMMDKKYSKFTVLPTTACNARCVYCYEEGIKFISMDDETVEQTINFIKKVHNHKRPVRFGWFGGEPLMGEKIIDKIVNSLREDGIEVVSSMISNGSLITSEIVNKMCNSWNLKRIQITLDGPEEQYNARKNYVFNYESAYWHVLSRIKMINEAGIKINIRINIDFENIEGIPTMLEDLKNFIPNPSLVTFDIAPLFNLQADENPEEIWDRSFEIADMVIAKGFISTPHYSLKTTKVNFCMADSPYTALVISPEGKLYPCEHIQSVESLGDVWTGVTRTDLIKSAAKVEPAREECKGCFALPYCTTFTGCPNHKEGCKYSARRRMERALDIFIRDRSAADEEEQEEC